jgi:uncharacterized cupin superfamily protein
MPSIVRFDPPQGPPEVDHPRPERRVRGNPRRETWPLYRSADGVMEAGLWTCEPGQWNIVFPEGRHEFFHVLEGLVRLHDAQGGWIEIRAGQSAVIPGGFVGAFEVIEAVRKHFVLVERSEANRHSKRCTWITHCSGASKTSNDFEPEGYTEEVLVDDGAPENVG